MSRSIFGWWGRELTDDDFACALAALGILQQKYRHSPFQNDIDDLKDLLANISVQDGVISWRLIDSPTMLNSYQQPTKASLLRDVWKAEIWLDGRLKIDRLEIESTPPIESILPWLVELLSRQATGLRSVYVHSDVVEPRTEWHWPIRVGCLPDQASLRLAEQLKKRIGKSVWRKYK